MSAPSILIVEDESVTSLDLQMQLNQLGYRVSAAVASGEEAMQMAEDLRPDLVLMDVALAGAMDGIEASRRMQLNRVVPVVYLTAYPTAFFRDPNLMQVPAICICKPVSRDDLGKAIEVALRCTAVAEVGAVQ